MPINPFLSGSVFGRLTAIKKDHQDSNKHWIWECRCSCGNITLIYATNLVRGLTTSCGCFRKEVGSNRATHGQARVDHRTSAYRSWCSILQRCTNPKNRKFKDYGGRGIGVCDRWVNSFENFFEDIGAKPDGKYSVGRIDNDGNYEPGNCRWETPEQQSRNRRNNIWIEYDGMRKVVLDWAIYLNVKEGTLREALKYKSPKNALDFYKQKSSRHFDFVGR